MVMGMVSVYPYREVRAVERVHHRNVVSYKHSWLEYSQIADFGPEVPCLFMLMEYANLGNLKQHIDSLDRNAFLPEEEIRHVFDSYGCVVPIYVCVY